MQSKVEPPLVGLHPSQCYLCHRVSVFDYEFETSNHIHPDFQVWLLSLGLIASFSDSIHTTGPCWELKASEA